MSRYLADVDLENDVVTLHDKNEELKSEFVKRIKVMTYELCIL